MTLNEHHILSVHYHMFRRVYLHVVVNWNHS